MEDGPGDDAEAEAVGYRVSERNQDQGEERGNGDQRIGPADFGDGGQHERADEDERGRGGCGGNDADEGSGDDGAEEQEAGDYRGDATAAAGHDAGCGLHVAGDGGGAGKGAEDGGGGVGEEDFVEAGDGVVGRDETGALGNGDQGAKVIEQVDEKEDEDDFEQALVDGAANVELEGGGGESVEAAGGGCPVDQILRPIVHRVGSCSAGWAACVQNSEGERPRSEERRVG